MVKKIMIFILIFTFVQKGYSQTEVSGTISSNTTWTQNNNPYIIIDDLTIIGGVTLEIEPGVIVNSNEGKKIKVFGSLLCSGVVEDSIYFNSCRINANYDISQSIRLNYCVITTSNLFFYNDYCQATYFKHCRFHNNINVIYNSIPHNQMYIDSCTFENNDICIYYKGTTVTNSSFLNNEIGINYANDIDLIKNCEFRDNTNTAIRIDQGSIDSNIIIGNNIGINTLLSNATIKNNIITNNNIGVLNNAVELNFSNNQICMNYEYNFIHSDLRMIDIPNNCWCSLNIDSIMATNSDSVNIEPVNTDCITFTKINTVSEGINEISIYPTFVNNYLHIDSKNQNNKTIDIIDCMGRKIHTTILKSDRIILDVSYLSTGMYFIISNNNSRSLRFFKK